MKDSKKSTSIRIVIRHISGSKTNQIDEFPIDQFNEISFGRAMTSDISFDPEIDDVVSRNHGKISIQSKDPMKIVISDSGSKNGVYVNKEKIESPLDLFPGDIIQLGLKGPEFQFDIHPPQQSYMKKTRVLESLPDEKVSKATRVSKVDEFADVQKVVPPMKEGVGKQTVERMMVDSQKKTSRNWLIGVAAGIIILLGLAYIFWPEPAPAPDPIIPSLTLTPTEIAEKNRDMVVFIEVGWKMTHTQTGDDVYHMYVPKEEKKKNKQTPPQIRAAYFQHNDGTIEPFIVPTSSKTPQSKLISGFSTGSGFVVSSEGFILTNRHVAGGWHTRYNFPPDAFPGVLYRMGEKGLEQVQGVEIRPEQVVGWVPINAKFFGEKPLGGKILEGKNIYLDVTFDGNDLRVPATVARISNKHDVTMIKIDMPESLDIVTIEDRHADIKAGDPVVVLGYPAVSPDEVILKGSQDVFNRNPQLIKVPSTTVTSGNVGRVIGRNSAENSQNSFSIFGDVYQLTINATGGGNSGGPMFDDQGRVIGIYFAGKTDQNGTQISFAVPIKYGLELMGRKSVFN